MSSEKPSIPTSEIRDDSERGLQLDPLIDGKYELIRPIGEGGFSWVFLARHRRIPSLKVAIKVLKATHAFDGPTVRRFTREAEASAVLKSRHSAKVMDIGTTNDGFPYLALELIRGAPLDRVLKERPQLSESMIKQIGHDILLALRDAHGFGLIHRDLKPANIFLYPDPHTGRIEARVIDFGIARVVRGMNETFDDASPMTVEGGIICTPAYAAPEVLRGDAVFQSDLYALGLVMAEMLDGDLVYKELSDFVVASKQLQNEPVPFGEFARKSTLFPIIEKACAKDPNERFGSAADMQEALNEAAVDLDSISQTAEDRRVIREIVAEYVKRLDDETIIVDSLRLESGLFKPSSDLKEESAQQSGKTVRRSQSLESHRAADESTELPSVGHPAPNPAWRVKSWRRRPVWQYIAITLTILLVGLAFARFGLGYKMWRDHEGDQIVISRASPNAPEPAVRQSVRVHGNIISDTRWTADRDWVLSDTVYVDNNAKLTIEPGTTVLNELGGALVVRQGASLVARGRRQQPIRFTSTTYRDEPEAGDWRGVLLLGEAPLNTASGERTVTLEDGEVTYGGHRANSSCGALEHVIFEYGGVAASASEEFNGLTLAGCGSRTLVRNVVIAHSQDDGLEIHGGSVNLRNIAVWSPGDDGLDWGYGWTGNVQNLVVVMGREGESAIEGDNNTERPTATPRSFPKFKNVTLVGTANRMSGQRAIKLRGGTGVFMSQAHIIGFPTDPVDIIGVETGTLLTTGVSEFRQTFITSGSTREPTRFSGELRAADDDGGFVEAAYFSARQLGHELDGNPLMRGRLPIDSYESLFVDAQSPLLSNARPTTLEADFWRTGTRYIGAIRPGGDSTWFSYSEPTASQ